jgi:hypothetical protein
MDLLDVIRKQIDRLSEGPHSVGLRSVLRHIEAAYGHLSRGQTQQDDSAFTDAIYRTNQAFEGSIKEAYRILAAKHLNHQPYTKSSDILMSIRYFVTACLHSLQTIEPSGAIRPRMTTT